MRYVNDCTPNLAGQPLQQILHDALQQIEFVSRHRQRLCA